MSHIASGAVDTTKAQLQQGETNLVNTAKGIYKNATTPTPEGTMLGTPLMPMPGIGELAENFAAEEAATPVAETRRSCRNSEPYPKRRWKARKLHSPQAPDALTTAAKSGAEEGGGLNGSTTIHARIFD